MAEEKSRGNISLGLNHWSAINIDAPISISQYQHLIFNFVYALRVSPFKFQTFDLFRIHLQQDELVT